MERGPSEARIVEECVRDGIPIPERIANAPELTVGLEVFYVAFWDLCSDRPSGLDLGQIPWSSIKLYCDEIDADEELREDMYHIIRGMDAAFLKHLQSKRDG